MGLKKGEGIGGALGRHFAFAVRIAVRGTGCWIKLWLVVLLQLKREK